MLSKRHGVELGVDFTELELDQLAVKNLMRLD